jgi:hypothetical protein
MPALQEKPEAAVPKGQHPCGCADDDPRAFAVDAYASDWSIVARIFHSLYHPHRAKIQHRDDGVRCSIHKIRRRF